MSSSSTNRQIPSAGHRPRPTAATAANNRQEWIPRTSTGSSAAAPIQPSDRPHPRPSRRHHAPFRTPQSADAAAVPQLVHEIQDKLARGKVECMICCDMVGRSAPIWSCSACFSIFHLHCVRKWARSPTSAADTTPTSSGDWRCPGCQCPQSTPARDLSYTCFCGRRHDPPNDLYLIPHSCGEPCGKPLDRSPVKANPFPDGEGEDLHCPHVCVLQCHPGPCPPCKAFAPPRSCPCGKTEVVRRCSDKQAPLSCGQPCNQLLSCGRHRCQRQCHVGGCGSCQELITASCFCGKKTETVLCGDMSLKGDFDEKDGLFSCNLPCDKTLSCGNHVCVENCHPGPCGECQLLPENIKTCHCGKKNLTVNRKSCLDPIPTCSEVCGKPLMCKTHFCKMQCHEGNCPPCSVDVEQRCRCGSSRRNVQCYQLFDEKSNFLCEKPCGHKKNCGRHRCSERCCPLLNTGDHHLSGGGVWDPHLCSVPCGKRLQCGNHSCQLLCHSGHCPPCLETIFTDLSCACGKTSIPPPVPCGTPVPSCPHPCLVLQPCGHPAPHSCHFGDCPPCTIPVMKECTGGHVMLRNIPCGSKDIRCNQLCSKTRKCGIHACARPCHPAPCDSSPSESGEKSSCGQVCGAPRRDCKHTCMSPCHPLSPCPEQRCDFGTSISCSCGRITATVPCGAGACSGGFNNDTLLEASVIQKLPVPLQPVDGNGKKVPLGQRKLACDEECDKAARKRQLADAFDVAQPNLDSLHFGESSAASEVLSDLMRREPKWVVAVEDRFKFMVLGKSKPCNGSSMKVHVFYHMLKEKRDAVRCIAERWKLSVQAAGWEPKRFLVVHATPKSKPPSRILGLKTGLPVTASQPPAFDPLIDMDPRLVVSMLDLPRDADISTLVLRFGGECEMVWLNDKNALAIFGDPIRAATALRRLDHGSPYQGAVAVLQNGGVSAATTTGGNAWGSSAPGNPWKKVVAPTADSWGPDWASGADSVIPVWKRNEGNPISLNANRWNLLDSDAESASDGKESRRLAEGRSATDFGIAKRVVDAVAGQEVDNWEEAFE